MCAHQIMTRRVLSVTTDTTIAQAANTMLQRPGQRASRGQYDPGKLVGIISEGDFIRRSEIGTQRPSAAGS